MDRENRGLQMMKDECRAWMVTIRGRAIVRARPCVWLLRKFSFVNSFALKSTIVDISFHRLIIESKDNIQVYVKAIVPKLPCA